MPPSTQNRVALILGTTAATLARHGWHIRALTRDPDNEAVRRQPGW